MVMRVAFMVTVVGLAVSLSGCCGCAQQVLKLSVCFPSVHLPPFKPFFPAARGSRDHRCCKWEQSFSHGLMSSDEGFFLQGGKRGFINPSLTSSPV